MADWSFADQPTQSGSSPAASGWGFADRGPTLGEKVSGFFQDVVSRLNPMPALRQWAGTSDQVDSALDAFHTLSDIHKAAAADPRNQGKPVNQWVTPEPTAAQRATIERGMTAALPTSEGPTLMSPALQAGREVQEGNPQGAAATMTAGYVVPALAGAALSTVGDAVEGARATLKSAAKNAPDLKTAADVVGLASPRAAHALRLLDKLRNALSPEEETTPVEEPQPAAEVVPPMYEDMAQAVKGKPFSALSAPDQAVIKDLADRSAARFAVKPPAAPAEAPSAPGPVSAMPPAAAPGAQAIAGSDLKPMARPGNQAVIMPSRGAAPEPPAATGPVLVPNQPAPNAESVATLAPTSDPNVIWNPERGHIDIRTGKAPVSEPDTVTLPKAVAQGIVDKLQEVEDPSRFYGKTSLKPNSAAQIQRNADALAAAAALKKGNLAEANFYASKVQEEGGK